MTATATTTDIAALHEELNEMIRAGKALEAFDRFYADDVVMGENDEEPSKGKALNRKREEEFFGSVAEVHDLSVISSAAGDDISFSEWSFDLTFKNGPRVNWTQTAVRRWENGRVVSERFYHKNLA